MPPNFIGSADAENKEGQYTTFMQSGGHASIGDEPIDVGGNNYGPAPGDYLCMALASCKAITLRMYVQRKQWKVGTINVNVKLVKSDQVPSGKNTFYCEIKVAEDIDADKQKRLGEIAKMCPVSKLLGKESEVVVIMKTNT